jgi:hypothetical protein
MRLRVLLINSPMMNMTSPISCGEAIHHSAQGGRPGAAGFDTMEFQWLI